MVEYNNRSLYHISHILSVRAILNNKVQFRMPKKSVQESRAGPGPPTPLRQKNEENRDGAARPEQ